MAIEEKPKNIFRLLNVLVSEKGLVRHLATTMPLANVRYTCNGIPPVYLLVRFIMPAECILISSLVTVVLFVAPLVVTRQTL